MHCKVGPEATGYREVELLIADMTSEFGLINEDEEAESIYLSNIG